MIPIPILSPPGLILIRITKFNDSDADSSNIQINQAPIPIAECDSDSRIIYNPGGNPHT